MTVPSTPTPHHAPGEEPVVDVPWAGGFIVGVLVGGAVGLGLALLLALLWYHGHCTQVPLVGGVYCGGTGVPRP